MGTSHLSQHLDYFGFCGFTAGGDIIYLIWYVTSYNHLIEGPYRCIGGSSFQYVTTLISFVIIIIVIVDICLYSWTLLTPIDGNSSRWVTTLTYFPTIALVQVEIKVFNMFCDLQKHVIEWSSNLMSGSYSLQINTLEILLAIGIAAVGAQRGQSYLMGRRCLFSLGWPPF